LLTILEKASRTLSKKAIEPSQTNIWEGQDEEDGEVTHCLTIVAISSDMTRLGYHADLCDKLGIRHRHLRIYALNHEANIK